MQSCGSRYALPPFCRTFHAVKEYLCFMFSEVLSWPYLQSLRVRGEAANVGFACQVAAPSPPHAKFAVYVAGFCHAPLWQQCANNSLPFSSTRFSPETYLFCCQAPSNVAALGFWLFFFCPDDPHISCWQLIGVPPGQEVPQSKEMVLIFLSIRRKRNSHTPGVS